MSQADDNNRDVDPMGCLEWLRHAAGDTALAVFDSGEAVHSESRRAACRLAAALGECRLFGVELQGPLNGTLPAVMAKAAAEEAIDRISEARSKAEQFPDLWDRKGDPFEAEELCLGLVEERLILWAVTTAIEEAFVGALDDGIAATSGLDRVWYQVLEEVERLDTAMQEHRSFLAVATETNLLDNWRGFLVTPHRDALPWVLDGSLETAAAELETVALATQPQARRTSAAVEEVARADRRHLGRQTSVLRVLEKRMEDLTEAFRRKFSMDAMQAIAANSDKEREVRVLWDSKEDLAPLRCVVYLERDGDLRVDLTSTDDNDENQTYEVVVKEQTRPTVTFRRDPETGELYGETRIPRDELPETGLSKLTFRLKKS